MAYGKFSTGRLWQFALGSALAFAAIFSERASAEIVDAAANGFTIRETAHIAASSDKVYSALIEPQRWWSPHHTFSGNSANLNFDAKAGGCWCETMPGGGSVLHMTVVDAQPGRALRLRGAMGPFQTLGAEGALAYSLTPNGDGTDVTLSYAVGGYSKDGLDKLANIVDHVYGEQLARLKTYIETGSPPSPQKLP